MGRVRTSAHLEFAVLHVLSEACAPAPQPESENMSHSFSTIARKSGLMLSAVAVASAMIVAGAILPANAVPITTVSVSPTSVKAGGTLTVSGPEFPSDNYEVGIDGAIFHVGAIESSEGFNDVVTIPASTTLGYHTLTISHFNDGPDKHFDFQIYVNATGPVGTAAKPSITVADLTTPGKGQTVTLHGFIPGETVDAGFGTGGYGGPTGDSAVADASGAVTFSYVFDDAAPGSGYSMNGIGRTSQANAFATFTVVADPQVASPAPVAVPVTGNASFTG